MRYVAIDIETTGLDPNRHQILEFAAVYDDLKIPIGELPRFVRKIKWDNYFISEYCLYLHRELLREISEGCLPIVQSTCQLAKEFENWLGVLGLAPGYNVAGKNFAGFDGLFLKKIPNFPSWNYRVIDVGSMYVTKEMFEVPSQCTITHTKYEHRALNDALGVVFSVRKKLL